MTDDKFDLMDRAQQSQLLSGLVRQGMQREHAEAVVHALEDIANSMEKVYGTLLPDLIGALDQPNAIFKDRLWDIREEFRHVAYHLRDARLTEL